MAKTMQLLLVSLLVVGTSAITNETTPDPSAYQPLICVVVGNQFFAKLKTESGSDQDPGDLWWRMVSERWDSDEAGINIFPFPGFIITRKSNEGVSDCFISQLLGKLKLGKSVNGDKFAKYQQSHFF